MAQKVQVLLVDDLDGGEASETVSFALDGNNYEIDLSGKNATEMRDSFAKYVGAARKVGRSSSSLRPVRPAQRRHQHRHGPRPGGRHPVLGEEARPEGQRPRPDPGHDHRAVQPVRLSRRPRGGTVAGVGADHGAPETSLRRSAMSGPSRGASSGRSLVTVRHGRTRGWHGVGYH